MIGQQQQLKDFIKKHVSVTGAEMKKILQAFEWRAFQKGEKLKENSEMCKEAYFLNKGLVAQYQILDKGKVHQQFYFPNTYFSEFSSFINQLPSEIILESLKNCTTWVISFENLQTLYHEIPQFQKFGRLMAEQQLKSVSEMNGLILNHTPEERYEKLLTIRPEVVNEIPQYMVASFIGISPEAFSRIKGKIVRKKIR